MHCHRPHARRAPRSVWLAGALAGLLAAAPAARAADRYWTFIGGCGSADWFGTTTGPNSQGLMTCWSPLAGGISGAPAPSAVDDVYIVNTGATQPLLVNFAAALRGSSPAGQAGNISLRGSSSFAAGLAMDRGSLLATTLTLGTSGSNQLGQFDQSGGLVSAVTRVDVLSGDYNLRGGTLNTTTLNLRAQTGPARVTQTGGDLVALTINLGSEGGAAASFSQLAGKVSSSALNIGTVPGSVVSQLAMNGSSAQWSNSGATVVGVVGNGQLSLAGGAQASTGSAMLGSAIGSAGRVEVQGAGTRWTVKDTLGLGNGGSAELVITQGAQVSAGSVNVDSLPASGQALLLQGSGSALQVGNALVVGRTFDGAITLDSGAQVSTKFGVLGDGRGVKGTATLNGAGTEWRNTTSLVVGSQGRGTLTAGSGAVLTAGAATVGEATSSNGEATLSGTGTRWTTSGLLTVGQAGTGKISADSGAKLESASAAIGWALSGNGTVDLNGARWSNTGLLTISQGGQGQLLLRGGAMMDTGAINMAVGSGTQAGLTLLGQGTQLDLAGALSLGGAGAGTLQLNAGAILNTGSASFGELAGGSGSANIGSQVVWTNRGGLLIGGDGSGTLSIAGNGTLASAGATLGAGANGSGIVTLAGSRTAEARWTLSGPLVVGGQGSGKLSLLAGGVVETSGATTVGAKGQVTLDGGTLRSASLALADPSRLDWRSGQLAITGPAGATLGAQGLPSQLSLGTGKTFNVSQTLAIGAQGRLDLAGGKLQAGTLALNGGRVIAASDGAVLDMNGIGLLSGQGLVDAPVSGGQGKRITATGALTLGRASLSNGFAYRGTLEVGSQTVTVNDSDLADLGALTTLGDGSRLLAPNGVRLAANGVLQASGQSSVQAAFTNNGQVDGGSGRLTFGAAVTGAGGYGGNIDFEAGFAPGNGVANIGFGSGNLSFGNAAVLTLDINGSSIGRYDRLSDIGALSFAGALVLSFASDFTPGSARLTLLDFDSFSGSFDPARISVSGIDPGRLDFSRLATQGLLLVSAAPGATVAASFAPLDGVAAAVPEPGTWALWLAGLGVMGALARRRRTRP